MSGARNNGVVLFGAALFGDSGRRVGNADFGPPATGSGDNAGAALRLELPPVGSTPS